MLTPGFCKAPRCQFCACFLTVADEGRDSPKISGLSPTRLVAGASLLAGSAAAWETCKATGYHSTRTVNRCKQCTNENENISSQWRQRVWKEIATSRWSESRVVICSWNWRSTHWHKTFSMHLCFRSASCGILSDLGFQGPPRNFERISDSKKSHRCFFLCAFLLFQLVSYLFFPIFTFDISLICSKWNLTKVVLRPRTVSGTLELRSAE